jgi:hypothetical protein
MNIIDNSTFKKVGNNFNMKIMKLVNNDSISNEIIKIYTDLGNTNYINNNNNINLEDIKNNEILFNFILKLEHYASFKDLDIKDFNYSKYYNLYKYICLKNDDDLNKMFLIFLDEIENEYKEIMSKGLYRSKTTKKGKVKEHEFGQNAYKNYLNKILDINIVKFNEKLCYLFKENINKYSIKFVDNANLIIMSVNNLLNILIDKLFKRSMFTNLNSNSLQIVNKIKEYNIEDFQKKGKYNFKEYFNIIDYTNNKYSPLRADKFKQEIGLYHIIEDILGKKDLVNKEKQLLIEKCVIDYEMKFFEEQFKSAKVDNIILHETYNNMKIYLDRLCKEYKVNKMKKLKIELDKGSSKGKVMSLILFMDVEDIINFIFKQLLDLMSRSLDNEFRSNETSLSIDMAERYIRLVKYFILKKSNKGDVRDKNKLQNICKMDESFFTNLGKESAVILGETLLEIILSNSKLFERDYHRSGDNVEIFIKTKNTFINKLIISSVNITQLPMLIKPREISEDNTYSPYYNPEIYHIYNPFDTVVKPKYDQRDLSITSPLINNCVNYLNSIKFKINKDVLYFVINN